MTDDLEFARHIVDDLDGWVDKLVAPIVPPRAVPEPDGSARLEFQQHLPHTVMVGKLVRAVSGLRAALLLADSGYITECAALLRMVSDICTEVRAIGEPLQKEQVPTSAVREFVAQYFTPKPRTPEEHAAAERVRYVSREELMKVDVRLSAGTGIDGEQLRRLRQFLNMTYDSYVHGAYETTMELWDHRAGRFAMRGHPEVAKRAEFVEAVLMKLHEVVVAVEITAAVTAHAEVFGAARDARRRLDSSPLGDG